MVELSLPNDWFSPNFKRWALAFFLATLVILGVSRAFTIITFLSIVVLAILFYIIMINSDGINYSSLPSTGFPNPPHLGLDGINIENRFMQ